MALGKKREGIHRGTGAEGVSPLAWVLGLELCYGSVD